MDSMSSLNSIGSIGKIMNRIMSGIINKIIGDCHMEYDCDYVIPVMVLAHMFIMIFIIRITMNTVRVRSLWGERTGSDRPFPAIPATQGEVLAFFENQKEHNQSSWKQRFIKRCIVLLYKCLCPLRKTGSCFFTYFLSIIFICKQSW